MSKRIHHMGMIISNKEHERFHEKAPALTPKQHDAMMAKLGITKEQDEEWHRTHLTLDEQQSQAAKGINPLAVGGGFLAWCVKQGWLIQRGKQYLATREGVQELRKHFGIQV